MKKNTISLPVFKFQGLRDPSGSTIPLVYLGEPRKLMYGRFEERPVSRIWITTVSRIWIEAAVPSNPLPHSLNHSRNRLSPKQRRDPKAALPYGTRETPKTQATAISPMREGGHACTKTNLRKNGIRITPQTCASLRMSGQTTEITPGEEARGCRQEQKIRRRKRKHFDQQKAAETQGAWHEGGQKAGQNTRRFRKNLPASGESTTFGKRQ